MNTPQGFSEVDHLACSAWVRQLNECSSEAEAEECFKLGMSQLSGVNPGEMAEALVCIISDSTFLSIKKLAEAALTTLKLPEPLALFYRGMLLELLQVANAGSIPLNQALDKDETSQLEKDLEPLEDLNLAISKAKNAAEGCQILEEGIKEGPLGQNTEAVRTYLLHLAQTTIYPQVRVMAMERLIIYMQLSSALEKIEAVGEKMGDERDDIIRTMMWSTPPSSNKIN